MSGRRPALFAGGAKRLTRPAALPKTERARGNFSVRFGAPSMNLCLLWRWDEPESFADETAEHCDCACAHCRCRKSLRAGAMARDLRTAGGARRIRFHGAAPAGQRRTRQPPPVSATPSPDEPCRLLIPPDRKQQQRVLALTSPSPFGTLPTPWAAPFGIACEIAFITAAIDAVAPASPVPLTPSALLVAGTECAASRSSIGMVCACGMP